MTITLYTLVSHRADTGERSGMAVKPAQSEVELIGSVCERVLARLPESQAAAAAAFVRQYYRWVPAEDLADRSELDVYGAAIAQWNLALHRQPGEAKVHVYNPSPEQYGWSSPHSVLQIVSDDMPFLVDSVAMAMSDLGYGTHLVIHPVIRVHRDAAGTLTAIAEDGEGQPESVMHVEFDREPDLENLAAIKAEVEKVLSDVRSAVEDWSAMRERAEQLASGLPTPAGIGAAETAETETFLRWLADSNFTFIGYREYELSAPEPDGTATLAAVPGSGLGILRGAQAGGPTKLSGRAQALAGRLTPAAADEGQRQVNRAPAGEPRLRRDQALRRRRHGYRRVPLPRAVHDRRLQDQRTADPDHP